MTHFASSVSEFSYNPLIDEMTSSVPKNNRTETSVSRTALSIFKENQSESSNSGSLSRLIEIQNKRIPFSIIQTLFDWLVDARSDEKLSKSYVDLAALANENGYLDTANLLNQKHACLKEFTEKFGNQNGEAYWEMAKFSIARNHYEDGDFFYKRALELNPGAERLWLEYAHFLCFLDKQSQALSILEKGIQACPFSKRLLIKKMQLLEKLDRWSENKNFVHFYYYFFSAFDLLEIKLVEAGIEDRLGNVLLTREIFAGLLKMPCHTPELLKSICRFENLQGNDEWSLTLVLNTLGQNLQCWELCELALELRERFSYVLINRFPSFGCCQQQLKAMRDLFNQIEMFANDKNKLKIVQLKVQFEMRFNLFCNQVAQYFAFDKIIFDLAYHLSAPEDKWKVLVNLAKTQLMGSRYPLKQVNQLCRSILSEAGSSNAEAFLQVSLLHENFGSAVKARKCLQQIMDLALSQPELRNFFWHFFIAFEMRQNNFNAAKTEVVNALSVAPDDWKLWQILIQLSCQRGNEDQLISLFKDAIKQMPRSAEIVCEYARFFMNPCLSNFDLDQAWNLLQASIERAPEYGDSYIEMIRLKLMREGNEADLSEIRQKCYVNNPNFGQLWSMSKRFPLMNQLEIFDQATKMVKEELSNFNAFYLGVGTKFKSKAAPFKLKISVENEPLMVSAAFSLSNRTFHLFKTERLIAPSKLRHWLLKYDEI